MALNRVIVSGRIGDYGVKISWTAGGKMQTSFTLACEQGGREGQVYTTWIPVVIVGAQAEALADTLLPGQLVLLEGSLAYHKGAAPKGKDASSKLVVTCFSVEVLAPAAAAVSQN